MIKKILCLSLVGLCLSCSGKGTLVEQSFQTQTLHYGNGKEPQTLDPHLATGTPEWRIIDAIYEGLMGYDPKTALPIPGAAESFEISNNQKTYTFKIRTNAKWSNGDAVTAHDFVYGWRRILTPKLGAEYAFLLYPVKNAEEFNKGKITDFKKVGVKALDDHTLQVELNNPTPYFLTTLTHFATFPVLKKNIESFGSFDDRNNRFTRAGNSVGNGPFVLTDWKVNKHVVVKKNSHYWDADQVKLNEVRFYPIDQRQTDDRRYWAGETHLTHEVHLPKLKSYQQNKKDHLYQHPWIGTYSYMINVKVKPLDDLKVRMALKLSLDRDLIVKTVTQGAHKPSGQYIPTGTGGYESNVSLDFNVKKAQALLAEAGFPGGKGFPKITLVYNSDEENQSLAEAVQDMWRKNLGITIEIQNKDWKVYLDDIQDTGNYGLARHTWYADINDAINFLSIFQSTQKMYKTHWVNLEYDQLLTQSESEQNEAKRFEILKKAEKIILEDGPIIPLYTFNRIYLKSPFVKGWYENAMDAHPLKYVYLEKP